MTAQNASKTARRARSSKKVMTTAEKVELAEFALSIVDQQIAAEDADYAERRAAKDEELARDLELIADAVLTLEPEVETVPDATVHTNQATVEDLEAAVTVLEATESAAEDQLVEESAPEPTFQELCAAVSDEDADNMVCTIAAAVDQRAGFEKAKNPDNENIQRTLKKVRAQLVTKRAARVFLATNVDPAFINREENTGSRYNVYALGKLADVIYGVTDGTISNAINQACMRSLFRFKNAGLDFSMEVAKAAASDKIRIEPALRKHLISHTVSASTAPTQASSTMQALETLGVVFATGSKKNPVFHVTDAPIARFLEDKLLAA